MSDEMNDTPIVVDAHQRFLSGYEPLMDHPLSVGMIALGLVVETHARLAERLGDDAFESRIGSHVASSLRNALDAVGMRDDVLIEYDRQVASIRASYGECADELLGTAASEPDGTWPSPPEHSSPGELQTAVSRARALDAADASWPGAGSDQTNWVALLSEPGLSIEGYEELEPGVYTPRGQNASDQEPSS